MLYFFLVMDGLFATFMISTIFFGIILFISGLYFILENKIFIKRYGILSLAFFFSLLLAVLTPTTKQTAIIFGVPYLLENAQKIQLDKVPVKLVNYLNVYLDQEIDKIVKKDIPHQK